MKVMKQMKSLVSKILAGVLLVSALHTAVILPHAVSDDPGQGRLQGDVNPDFYQGATMQAKSVDATANVFTGLKYTHADCFDGVAIHNVIDVSEFNGNIDWKKVKAAGIDYAIIRVAFRGYGSAGNMMTDAKYQKNLKEAIEAGVKVGVYFWSQAVTTKEAQAEADYFASLIEGYNISLPAIMDLEYYSGGGVYKGRLYDAKLSKAALTSICDTFLKGMQAKGYTAMLYSGPSMFNIAVDATALEKTYPIWLANYTTKTQYTGKYEFWQYSSKGKVPGISTNTDVNFWYTNDTGKYENLFKVECEEMVSYTGSAVIPQFTVSSAGATLIEGTDYTYAVENNIEPGEATLTITGIGNYAGYESVIKFEISLGIADFKVSAAETKELTLSWGAVSGASGYELYRANAIDGEYTKVQSLDADTTTAVESGLSAGTEYYYYVVAKLTDKDVELKSDVLTARTKKATTKKLKLTKKYSIKESTKADAKSVLTIAKGQKLNITAVTKNKAGDTWYYVSYKYNGKTYYGYAPKSAGTFLRYAKTTSKVLNVRKGAGTSKKLVVTIQKKNSKVTVTGSKKDSKKKTWYKISYTKGKYTYKGYVLGKYLKFY